MFSRGTYSISARVRFLLQTGIYTQSLLKIAINTRFWATTNLPLPPLTTPTVVTENRKI